MELQGLETILKNLDKRLGPDRVKTVTNKALRTIAKEVEEDLKVMAYRFNRSGATVKQTTVGNVSWADYGIPRVKIGWRRAGGGESPRWNIEHLNEFGFTREGKSYRPRGFGQMQDLIDEQEVSYPKRVQEELKELVE